MKLPKRPDIQYRMAELRAADDGAGFAGYASHFGSVDSYGTAIKRGAFRKTIRERGDRIPVLWQHSAHAPIGKPTELKEDATGLRFSAEIVEATTAGRDAMALLREGVPLGMSFGFETIKSRPVEEADDLDWSNAPEFYTSKDGRDYVRVIEEVRLWEISLVTFPANPQATLTDVRALAELSTLSTLLEDLRSGALTDEDDRWDVLHHLVAAYQERQQPEPGPPTPLPASDARHRTQDIDIALTLVRSHGWTGA